MGHTDSSPQGEELGIGWLVDLHPVTMKGWVTPDAQKGRGSQSSIVTSRGLATTDMILSYAFELGLELLSYYTTTTMTKHQRSSLCRNEVGSTNGFEKWILLCRFAKVEEGCNVLCNMILAISNGCTHDGVAADQHFCRLVGKLGGKPNLQARPR
ncbi:expressed unknown protein [Seminavis robusta]|uniref:Uncharacterized protein n=1 Tax=Seminavis robusta TaxID=568900 RepID=A0A9N8HU26_9STRA|nr:expressed unknown protein [Seminavis robusta]|eukprot:Sro1684_g290981.1  (155) ;mRNA; r:7353-7817